MSDENREKPILTGFTAGITAVGLNEFIKLLTKKAEAAPPEGATLITLDGWTKDVLTAALGLLGDVSLKLNTLGEISEKLDTLTKKVDALIPDEAKPPKGFTFNVVSIEAQHIPMIAPRPLYETGPDMKGSVIAIELVSNSSNIDYDLILDGMIWSFNVADLVSQSIEYPHFPGAWIAKATGGQFVFMFSSGGMMGVSYKNSFSLMAKATVAAGVDILSGKVIEKVYE